VENDAQHQLVELDRRPAHLDKRKAWLEEAYLYEQAIDRDTYTRHSDRLSEERSLLQLGRHDAEIDGLDVETLLNYAEYHALNPGRSWQEAGARAVSPAAGVLGSKQAHVGRRAIWNRRNRVVFQSLGQGFEQRGEDGSP
jgi:hypothetical protein